MAHKTCPNCSTQVGSEEEFCTSCGEWMPLGEKPSSADFTLSGEPDMPPAGQPQSREQNVVHCPLCGSANPSHNRHCEECGARLGTSQLPVAPQPMINTTAAMRTALIAGGVLLGVLAIALLVRTFGGGPTTTTTLVVSPTTVTSVDPANNTIQAGFASISCDAEYGTHPCDALFDGGANDWNAPLGDRTTMTITINFDQPYDISGVGIINLKGDRFLVNARASAVELSTNDATTPQVEPLLDQEGALPIITFVTRNSSTMTIEIISWYDAQSAGAGEDVTVGFNDISIEEIQVWGVPSQ